MKNKLVNWWRVIANSSRYYFIAALLLLTATASLAQSSIILPVDYWDFLASGTASGTYGGYAGVGHPDFENYCCGVVSGLVKQNLVEPVGVPALQSTTGSGSSPMITSALSFSQWYLTNSGINVYVPGSMTLTNIGNNTFQFSSTDFFPLDGQGFDSAGFQGSLACDNSGPHNFDSRCTSSSPRSSTTTPKLSPSLVAMTSGSFSTAHWQSISVAFTARQVAPLPPTPLQ